MTAPKAALSQTPLSIGLYGVNTYLYSLDARTTEPRFQADYVVWSLLLSVEVALILRFSLKLLQVSPLSGFTDGVYFITDYLVAPVTAVFGPTISGNIFDGAALVALAAYWILATTLVTLFEMGRPITRIETARAFTRRHKRYWH